MSAICIALLGWVILNGALLAALMLRRDRPEARERLLRWVIKELAPGAAIYGGAEPPVIAVTSG
jgi:hypothetical protein